MKFMTSFVLLFISHQLWANSIKSITVNAQLSASAKCAKEGPMVAFVHFAEKPSEYLYQVEVPVGGTVEFSLIPGAYELEAVNKIGCFAKSSLDLRKPASTTHSLTMEIKE